MFEPGDVVQLDPEFERTIYSNDQALRYARVHISWQCNYDTLFLVMRVYEQYGYTYVSVLSMETMVFGGKKGQVMGGGHYPGRFKLYRKGVSHGQSESVGQQRREQQGAQGSEACEAHEAPAGQATQGAQGHGTDAHPADA